MGKKDFSKAGLALYENIEKAIKAGELTSYDLANIAGVARWGEKIVARKTLVATGIKVGDRVEFTSKTGKVVVGTVSKLNGKSVSLEEEGTWMSWRVSPSLLRPTTRPKAEIKLPKTVLANIPNSITRVEFKNEGEEGGKIVGAVWLDGMEFREWMTLAQARDLATQHNAEFMEV